ncbi:MAG: ATP-binding protein [Candidatus Heimdallarchaeaceae archaeon]
MNVSSMAKEKLIEELVKTYGKNLIAIYSFKREISRFNTILKDKEGLVLIFDDKVKNRELRKIDSIYDKIQDQFGWPDGVKIAHSFSRGYLIKETDLWKINLSEPKYLLPEDMINLINTKKLLYGEDVIEQNPLPYEKEKLLSFHLGLTREEAKKIAQKYDNFLPLVDPSICWARHKFTIKHKVTKIIEKEFNRLLKGKKPKKFIHIYGRYGGSGKTQIIYSLIKECKKRKLPFIYRTEFWKDEEGKYVDKEVEANKAENVSKWIANKLKLNKTIIFLDEVDIDLKLLDTLLAQQSKSELNYFIVSGAKELPEFLNDSFNIFDISTKYQLSKKDYRKILNKLIELSKIPDKIFPNESRKIIVNHTRFWNHLSFRRSPAAVILATSLSLCEAIKKYEKTNKEILVHPQIARKWSIFATSPLFQQYDETHDVHAEFFIYDGEKYKDIDPFYNHPLP